MIWLALLACSPEVPPPGPEAPRAPDILLVTIDTLRADRVGCYGDPLASTPVLDSLAERGVLFREAHAAVPLTLPSHASILTGLYPAGHGLRDNAGFRLDDGVQTLAETLQAGGFQTGAFVSAFVLDSAWGLDQGFDVYHDPFHPEDLAGVGAFGEVELPGAEVVNAALGWWKEAGEDDGPVVVENGVEARRSSPRFAWVHLYDPHTPWREHPGWEGDPYRGEVQYVDSLVGRLVQGVGEDAVIIVTSDHGESLWDHGEREHGVLIGRSVTRVPLIVRPPGGLDGRAKVAAREVPAPPTERPEGVDAGLDLGAVPDHPRAARVVEAPVSGVDLAPTIAEFAGLSMSGDGRSLAALAEPEPHPVYAETWFPLFHYGWSGLRMAQDDGARVEVGARVVAFDWRVDPWGSTPIEAPAGLLAEADRLKGEGVPQPGRVDEQTAQALEALGYLSAGPAEVDESVDPRDRVALLGELHAAEAFEDPAEAVSALSALVSEHPDLFDARLALSLARARAGDPRGALEDTQAVLARWPDHPTALSNAAVLSRSLGESDQALAYAHRMQALNPLDARGFRIEAAVQVDRDNAPEVLRATAAGLLAAPDDPNLHYLHALAQVQAGDPAVAIEHLEAARRNGSRATDISMWLGVASERSGDIDAAARHYKDATLQMPGDPRPGAMAGVMLYKAGRCEEAMPFLVNVARRGGGRDPLIQEALKACSSAQ